MIIKNGTYTVYILISKTTGKLYVGVTGQKDLDQRFQYGNGYKHNKDFYGVIKEFGWDDIEQCIFARRLTKDEAFNMEQTLIGKLREQCPDLVCNKDSGGEHGKHCDETKEIIRKANVGRVITEEAKEKIRKARATQVFSAEALAKRSAKMKGRKMSPEFCKRLGERTSKPIRCLENNKTYKSLTEASADLNVSMACISMQLKGTLSQTKGYHFERI